MHFGSSAVLFLGFLTITFAYAVFRLGGVEAEDWNLCLLALGVLAAVYWLRTPRIERAPALCRALRWLVLGLPCYAAFQLIPLPLPLLKVLSPERAELHQAVGAVAGGAALAPLSVAPAATLAHLLRIAACSVVFLLVREIAWRASERPWVPAVPIVAVAAVEAALGLVQVASGASLARGTYINRNHFAGLLEMALPFAVLYAAAILRREGSRRRSPAAPAAKACGMLAVAALILLGIIYSLSRMGFVAALLALLVAGLLVALAGALPPRARRPAIAGLAALLLLGFVFLPPDQLVGRFAQLSSTEQITAEGRLLLWSETLRLIAAYPLFGCGLGGYESAFLRYKITEPLVRDNHAHSDYLELLAELGAFGFVVAAALMIGVLRIAVGATAPEVQLQKRYLALACTAAMAAILVHSLVDFNLYIPANAMLLAWICGLSAALELSPRWRGQWPSPGVPPVIDVKIRRA